MESKKSANEPARPELSKSDIQWLQETLGIEIFHDYKWNSNDYAHAFEHYFEKSEKCQLNAQNSDGNTPLHLVAVSDNYPAIEALLMCGADVNILNNAKQTAVTYSQQYPDYSVGFQFFRHIHKLDFLEQDICSENSDWYCKVRKIYNQRYPNDRHIAAFTHNPSLDKEVILDIRAGGEQVIYQMYGRELQKFNHAQVKKRPLRQILNLTDRNMVAANRLKNLERFIKCHNFHNNYPFFGFMFKQKYRQSLQQHNIHKQEYNNLSSSPEKSLKNADTHKVNGVDHVKNLQTDTDRCMTEFMARKDTVVVQLAKESMQHEEIDQQKAAEACKGSVDNTNKEKNNAPELSSNEKLERLKKLMAQLQTK